jgi:flagellar protein FlbT
MPGLVLELKQDEMIIINGAAIRFRSKARIEITGKARFLFGKQILTPEDATTPAAQIYRDIQTIYIGNREEQAEAITAVRGRIRDFQTATESPLAAEILDSILSLVEADDCYEALKLARRIMRHEAALAEQQTDAGAA